MSEQGQQEQDQQGPQQSQGQSQQTQEPDNNALGKKFSEGYNAGLAKAERDFQADLQKRFQVGSLDDIQKRLDEVTKKGHPDQIAQIETLNKQITELQSQRASDKLNFRIQAAMAGLTPHRPDYTAGEILGRYDVQVDDAGRETIFPKGSRELVVLDGKPATLKDLAQHLSKQPEFAWQFGTAKSTNVEPGQSKGLFNDSMLKDPKFVAALRSANEYMNFINGRPVNEAAVQAFLK